MAGQKMETGPTAKTVAENIKRVREDQRLTYTDVSRQLSELGRNVSPLAVRRMEEGERRVDVDDLMALSVALGVAPISLLMPDTEAADSAVQATGIDSIEAEKMWAWMRLDQKLDGHKNAAEMMELLKVAAPAWRGAQYAKGILKLLKLRKAELKAESGDRSDLDFLLEEYRNDNGDD